jgi:shikimate kinase
MTHPDRIYLVGLMGAGKSKVGTLVASALARPYLDNDAELARVTGRTTLEWAAIGQIELHDVEANYALDVTARSDAFVAGLAASVADRVELADPIHVSGFVVYLRARPHTLAARVSSDPERPWLHDDPETVLTEMFVVRDDSLAALADFVVDTDDLRSAEVADLIVKAAST